MTAGSLFTSPYYLMSAGWTMKYGILTPVARGRLELLHDLARGIEFRRQRLDQSQRARRRIAEPKRAGREKSAYIQKRKIRAVVGGAVPDRHVVRQIEPGVGPASVSGGAVYPGASPDVVEGGEQELVARRTHVAQRVPWAWRPDGAGLQPGRFSLHGSKIELNQRARWKALISHRPTFVQTHDHAATDERRDVRLGRDIQQLCSLRLQHVGLVPKEIEPAHDESEAAALAVMKDGRNGAYIVALVATKNLRRGGKRLATRQPLDNVGVAGGRQVTGRPLPADQDVVGIF